MTDLWITVIIIVGAVATHMFTKVIKQLFDDVDSLRDSVNELNKHTSTLYDRVIDIDRNLGKVIGQMEQVKKELRR